MDITLDTKSFKALSADTRVRILKNLKSRRYTQSELADILKLKTPTVKEHLDALEKADLVRKIDEGRKWKYYELTSKAKAILDPERKQIFIALGIFLLSTIGMIYLFFKNFLASTVQNIGLKESVASTSSRLAKDSEVILQSSDLKQEVASNLPVVETVQTEPSYWLYIFAFIAVVSLVLLIYFLIRRNRRRI